MRDIRLLKLYKQHYQDKFEVALDTKFSSWGYYDGFEVVKADASIVSKLFTMGTESPSSGLYYASGNEICHLAVGKSAQIIGIFRGKSSDIDNGVIDNFWAEVEKLPYFAIGFLKVREDDVQNLGELIEERYDHSFDSRKDKGCRCLTYLTYDNADLIVFLSGNSIEYMMRILQEIEEIPQFSYMHNVCGVAEALLHDSKENADILENWKGADCNINEEIGEIEIKFVTSGNDGHILKGLKAVFDMENIKWKVKNYEKLSYTYISGHENLLLKLEKTDVKSLLALLIPGGFLTHQNIMYERGVYNIETSIHFQEKMWNAIQDEAVISKLQIESSQCTAGKSWCEQLIEQYKQLIKSNFEKGDEGFSSYFQSLLLTLNTLNQYERFSVSEELFFMIFPALRLFNEMFMEAYTDLKDSEKYMEIRTLKDSLCKFITYVNSIIYHTIHTDQVFLMIPGYSGTSYSIPIKLNMMYYWFTNAIKDVLNDGHIVCQTILVPDMEANPKSNLVDFGKEMDRRLIYIYFSQRTLFLPKNLMIILAHEMGHYVGRKIRMREKRWSYLLDSISQCIVEGIVYDVSNIECRNREEEEIREEYMKSVLKKLYYKIYDFLNAFCKKELADDFHGERMAETLKQGIYHMITSQEGDIEGAVKEIPEKLKEKLRNGEKFNDYSRYIYQIQTNMINKVKNIAYTNGMEGIVDRLIRIYREVFSDIAALAILQCDFRDFCEAHQVSEGVVISEKNVSTDQCMREFTVDQVVYGKNEQPHVMGLGRQEKKPDIEINILSDIYNNLYTYKWVKCGIIQYADGCYKEILNRLEKPECKAIVNTIRQMFNAFKQIDNQNTDIYTAINTVNKEYVASVKDIYEKCNNN